MDSRIQRLLFVASTLGLCRYDDVDLIRGVVPASRQSAFMDHLLDLVCIADSAEDPQNKLLQEPGLVSEAMTLEQQTQRDLDYLNTLCCHGNLSAAFPSKVTLLPPDLQRLVEDSWVKKGATKDKPPKLDFQFIEQSALQLADDIEKRKELLQDLKKHYEYNPSEDTKQETVCRTISLVLSELSQLVTGFTYCYENEMRHWCNKSPPALTQLGPAFKRVHRLLQQFVQVLKSLGAIRGSYTALNRDAPEQIAQLSAQSDTSLSLVGMGEEALSSLQNVVKVLEESIQHMETGSSTQTTPRSVRSTTSTLK